MKAARLHAYHDALKLEEVDEPKALGPHDVIVKIGAAGLCRTDLHIQEGQWAEKSNVALPYTPGHENAGWVHEVGSGVSNVEVGDTVIVHPFISCGLCTPCRRGDDMHCVNGSFPGINRDGGFAEFLLDERALGGQARPVAAPDADRRARRRGPDRDPRGQEGDPGPRRRHQGGRDRRRRAGPHRHPVPEGLHADRDHRRRPEREGAGAGRRARAPTTRSRSTARSATRSRSSPTGWAPRRSSTSSVRRAPSRTGSTIVQDGGFYYVIGYGENINIPTIDVISREISFIGNLVGTYVDLQDLMTLTAQGQVTLHTSTYPLDAINDAMADLDQGRLQGRGILVPG